jgi:hypothetical protein
MIPKKINNNDQRVIINYKNESDTNIMYDKLIQNWKLND